MNVYGIDFTSRPSRSKAITCAKCQLDGDRLVVDYLQRLESLDAFGAFLDSPGPWIAGIDFPFGQPRRLVENLNWPGSWAGYVAYVAGLSREGFRSVLEDYKRDRAEGDREHLVLLARFAWRAIRQLLEAPARVVAFDERSDGRAHLGEVSKDPAVDGLLLERAIPALDDPVGFGLFNEGEAGVDASVANLVEKVVREILAAVIHP